MPRTVAVEECEQEGAQAKTEVVRTQTARTWMEKPSMSKRSSPYEVRATPSEIMQTIPNILLLGSEMRTPQEIRRTATALNACRGRPRRQGSD